jgi:hypothetical protein
MNLPLGKVGAFYLLQLAGFSSFRTQWLSDTLEAPADSLVLSELAKLGAHSC